jgi:hypothetical protein
VPYAQGSVVPALCSVQKTWLKEELLMEPVRILQLLIEYLNENTVDGEALVSSEDPDGNTNLAEARISWGGGDLFDLRIERV